MKKNLKKLLVYGLTLVCGMLLTCCSEKKDASEDTPTTAASQDNKNDKYSSVIYDHKWQSTGDKSLIVCEKDGSFKYYQSEEDLTDNYFEGTYSFYVGKDAVDFITTELAEYSVKEGELDDLFDKNEEYNEDNFVCLVLHNEQCLVLGENQIDEPYNTPYYGFILENDGKLCLDIANMNSGNYTTFISK